MRLTSTKPRLTITPILINERTSIRTIVKWSKSAVICAVVIVLLVAYVFTSKAYAESTNNLVRSQQETSKIKSQKEKLLKESQQKDARIQQLEQENAELKG